MTVPSKEQLDYARHTLTRRRAHALSALMCGDLLEDVTQLVFGYVESDDADDLPSAGDVALDIVRRVARELEPFVDGEFVVKYEADE